MTKGRILTKVLPYDEAFIIIHQHRKLMGDRHTLENLLRAVNNPVLFLNEIQRGKDAVMTPFYNALRPVLARQFFRKHGQPIDIMTRDWDNLIILDACRSDFFREINWIDGSFETVISKGSHSSEFYQNTFEDKNYYDTVYATANPYGAKIVSDVFYDMRATFEGDVKYHNEKERVDQVTTDSGDILLDRHKSLLKPHKVTEKAVELHEGYPNKRLIVHYMQPHTPYLSEEAAKIRQKLSEQDVFFDRFHTKSEIQEAKSQGKIVVDSLMTATERGYVSLEKLEKLYKENLELVLCEVEGLVDTLDGKTVITADHGEHLGEGGEFAHPKGKYNRTLREVPWLELPFDDRRNVFEGEPVNETAVSQEGIDQQLEALGYR